MLQPTSIVTIAVLVIAGCAVESPDHENETPAEAVLTEEAVLAAQKAGYTLVTRNGEHVLCRRDPQTGTRLQYTTVCLTAREWARVRTSTRDSLQDITGGQKSACAIQGNC